MKPRYNEKKATQVAARILRANGGKMDLLDLMKTIYCIDRAALLKLRWPMTGDRYAALPKGMILSRTYDLAKDEGFEYATFWDEHIKKEKGLFAVNLTDDPGRDELSEKEIELIESTLAELSSVDRSTMIERIHHKYPEWSDPHGSSFGVLYETVLEKEGWKREEIEALSDQVELHSQFECIL
jgi:hypothetical protein